MPMQRCARARVKTARSRLRAATLATRNPLARQPRTRPVPTSTMVPAVRPSQVRLVPRRQARNVARRRNSLPIQRPSRSRASPDRALKRFAFLTRHRTFRVRNRSMLIERQRMSQCKRTALELAAGACSTSPVAAELRQLQRRCPGKPGQDPEGGGLWEGRHQVTQTEPATRYRWPIRVGALRRAT